ncbi:phospho-sugar mutase [Desulfitobacterium sp.]|uniref:phospho-sugar mutase n=1 Tax=Desulfitobacterium sp. TaxID=49981 RepID=UPI002C493852|nr:phospho-sugar mutase [Desulfitobacterium sp.]HVJ48576.1 phospho-sugar mutase [Desulfitobacterium sp.]
MIQELYKLWSEHPYFDLETRQELKTLTDPSEIEDRFYMDLEFGTGGLRGILAAGTNRMNIYVIRKATQGLADTIREYGKTGMAKGVVIAYDSRRFSLRFAQEAALILAKNGIRVYLFDNLRPTPELSFAVRYLKAQAGIVITASHNPKEYNGYKVYWEDGGQVPPTQADRISEHILAHASFVGLEPLTEQEARSRGLLISIGEEIDQAYLSQVKNLALYPNLARNEGSTLKIVYSPLHGAGNLLVRRVLQELGYTSVFVVPEQEKPDPNFSTVPYPNPEIPSTFDLARRYGELKQADLLLATDPDSDRLGVVIRNQEGQYVQLTGNQVGVILAYYLISQKKALGILPPQATLIKTIASTDLADALALDLGVQVENVLTGFKFIAEKEKELEEEGRGDFQFGFEESYGYLAGHFVRDKDGVIAAMLVAEAALYYKQKEQQTLLQVLDKIYQEYGYYVEDQTSITLKGKEGKAEMEQIMAGLRHSEIRSFAGVPLVRIDDYELRIGKHLSGDVTDDTYPLTLPQSEVLRYAFSGGGFVMVRPSGTEPKIKFYFSIRGTQPETVRITLNEVKDDLLTKVSQILGKPLN